MLRILAYGDSLTAGYGLDPADAYPAQLQTLLKADKLEVEVVNGGVSGDTSAQALRRVDWTYKRGPFDLVLLCIGANDGLRLLPLADFEKNLTALIDAFKKKNARVLLLGMRLPKNLDANYRATFEGIFLKVAKKQKIPFLPFLLEGVATDQMLNQEDQIHPNREGAQRVAKTVRAFLAPELRKFLNPSGAWR